jgi:predicted permease
MNPDAVKYWKRHPVDAAWIVGVLSIGLATAAAAVAIAQAVLLKPLPVADASSLVRVFVESRDPDGGLFPTEYVAWKERQRSLSALASYQFEPPLYLHLPGDIVRINGLSVTTNMFEMLGVRAREGRLFLAADAQDSGRPIVISERLWARAFGSRPDVIGQPVVLSDSGPPSQRSVIVGVLPSDLEIQNFFLNGVDVYRPVTDDIPPEWFGVFRTSRRYAVGRLKPEVSTAAASAELAATARAVATEIPTREQPTGARVESLHASVFSHGRRYVLLLGFCVALMLSASILNSSSVLLALAARREKELAVRRALGASDAALIRQALADATVLALTSGAIGLLLGHWLLRGAVSVIAPSLPRVESASIGLGETTILLSLVVLVGILLTVLPILLQKRGDTSGLREASSSMSPRARRMRIGLIAVQQAVVLAIVAAAALSATTLWHMLHRPLGFDADGLATVEVAIPNRYSDEPRRYSQLIVDLQQRIRVSGATQELAIASNLPLRGRIDHASIWNAGGQRLDGTSVSVTPTFFDVMRIPVLAGRPFGDRDQPDAVAVVNRKLAVQNWGEPRHAIGQFLRVGSRQRLQIVGVTDDVLEYNIVGEARPTVYLVFGGPDARFSRLFVVSRFLDKADSALNSVKTEIRQVDHELYVNPTWFSDRITAQSAEVRLQSAALILIGVVTLGIVGLGVFALIGQLTVDGQRESAIRVSLGASQARAVGAALVPMTKAVLIALPVGALAGWATLKILPAVVPSLVPATNIFWVGSTGVLIVTNCIAALFPILRALKLNVPTALRHQ